MGPSLDEKEAPIDAQSEEEGSSPDQNDRHDTTDCSFDKNFGEAMMGVFGQIDENILQHRLAAKYFQFRQFWFFTFSQAVLTLLASVLAFTTADAEADAESRFKYAAGTLSALVVFLQTMSGNCDYGTRAAMHAAVVIDLRNLKEESKLLMARNHVAKIDDIMEAEEPANYGSINGENEDKDEKGKPISSFREIEGRFRQSITGCKSMVPNNILQAFTLLSISAGFIRTEENKQYHNDRYGHSGFLDYSKEIHRSYLASAITEYFLFPLFLPEPSRAVEATWKRFRKEIQYIGAPLQGDLEAGCW
jgi:hypothetical protein